MNNKVKVIICGKEYSLQTDEAPEYVIGMARQLGKQIDALTNRSDNMTVHSATLLIAMSYLDDLAKANATIDNIRTQIREYVDDAAFARLERDEMQKENDALKIQITELKNQLKLASIQDTIQHA